MKKTSLAIEDNLDDDFEDAQHSSAMFLTHLLPLTIVMLNASLGVFSNHPK